MVIINLSISAIETIIATMVQHGPISAKMLAILSVVDCFLGCPRGDKGWSASRCDVDLGGFSL